MLSQGNYCGGILRQKEVHETSLEGLRVQLRYQKLNSTLCCQGLFSDLKPLVGYCLEIYCCLIYLITYTRISICHFTKHFTEVNKNANVCKNRVQLNAHARRFT